MTRVFQLEKNISNLNLKLEDLKNYLVKYMSSDISKKIIEQIETIEKSLSEAVPQNIKKLMKRLKDLLRKKLLSMKRKQLKKNVKKRNVWQKKKNC